MIRLRRVLLATTLSLALWGPPVGDAALAQGRGLAPPFRTAPPRSGPGDQGGCPATPPPTLSLAITTPYQKGDPTFSHLDPQAERAVEDQMKPSRQFVVAVDVQANRYTLSNGANEAAGACALAMMDSWAKAGALTQLTGHDAYLFRANLLTALSLDFMQVRGLDTGDQGQRRRIADWLHGLGMDSLSHWSSLPANSMVNLNNHRAWAGFAVAAAGVATGDRQMFDWGMNSGKVVACEADDRGGLPREIGRAGRARLYSLYAAEPLVMTAELGAANGVDLYSQCDNAIHRIVAFALRSIDDPSQIESRTGVKQEDFYKPDGSFNKQQIAWAEVYEHRFPGRAPLPAGFASGRPYFSADLGGGIGALVSR